MADNILSPLGLGTHETVQAIMQGKSALRHYASAPGVHFAFTAALFSDDQFKKLLIPEYTRFESLAINSIRAACSSCDFDKAEALLVISTTKGNVGMLQADDNPDHVVCPGVSARRIAKAVGVETEPIVVCNACVSGLSALLLANRMVEAGDYDHAIVCGIDLLNPFIISGFHSLQALSEEECRPFDIDRNGLNLGEAAATIILSAAADEGQWAIQRGAVANDAYHISSPHPQGDGLARAISTVMEGIDPNALVLINAHGTATMYNDQMEAKAISRCGLSDIPTNALKGYLGHTLGAAGIVETIVSLQALDRQTVVATKGFN